MKRFLLPIALSALPSDPQAAPGGGTVTGSVITMRNGNQVTDVNDVYVYLMPLPGRSDVYASGVQATIKQHDLQFDPRVVIVASGAQVAFPNSEDDKSVEHNVFSPGGRKRPLFDLQRYTSGHSKTQQFNAPGEFNIYCDVHKDMTAKVKVIDSVWIARVTAGKFSITNVPKGRYKAVVWAPDSTDVFSDPFPVEDGGTVTVPSNQLNLQLGMPKSSHLNKFNQPYPPYPPHR